MKFFNNRVVALIIAAAVVAGSTAVNCAVGLHREANKIEESFFSVKNGKAPNYYVDQTISAAASLATVGGHYGGTEEAVASLREYRKELVEAQEERDLSDMYTALRQLSRHGKDLADFLTAAQAVTPEDEDALKDAVTTLEGAARKLDESGYNDAVLDFARGSAYRRLWIDLLDIEGPELFDAPFD